ncbi:MAG: helix-turn-helix domain-containing protein [Eubacterium ventriosum]|uniref:helix-turn-helix domain-containing protein n=1 Tax=Eubacterium ventriosum TaxID=39496 RepID=UPI00300F3D7A
MPKQLSLSERIIIERMISKDYSFASIGRNLERSASTISREVIKYRCFVDRIPLPGENDCTHKNSCLKNSICDDVGVHGCYGYRCKRCPEDRICTNICASYESSQCPLLDKPPYVCTNCSMLKQCKRNKAYYTAHRADAAHHKSIRNAHSGVRKTPSELRAIADIIEPLIAKGQSLNHICATHLDEWVYQRELSIITLTRVFLRFVILTFLKRLFTGNVGLKRFLPSLNTNIDKVAPMKISNPSWKQTQIYLL